MGIAAFQKSTGRMIEWQSRATPGTCRQNAVNAGFASDDVEERELSIAEAMATIPPTTEPRRLLLDDLADLLVERGIVTRQDIDGQKV